MAPAGLADATIPPRALGLLLAVLALLPSACAYRLSGPPALDQAIAIHITGNQSRLPLMQNHLLHALATALREDLGWSVSSLGEADLAIALGRETIDESGRDQNGVTSAWQVSWNGSWRLQVGERPVLDGVFSNSGSITSRAGEDRSMADAAETIAESIAAAIEAQAQSRWVEATP